MKAVRFTPGCLFIDRVSILHFCQVSIVPILERIPKSVKRFSNKDAR
ncbi:hypothetical protein CEV33_0044 [Brucella grignonensis]|uniref:Uncharacterized protein n=1 Tax=Brucella grignonensis TaxID=94627 RepID=A0A256FMB7_9HYPH|nr:hypothetical protein CEV33_0044 [Brucella grignonensis]